MSKVHNGENAPKNLYQDRRGNNPPNMYNGSEVIEQPRNNQGNQDKTLERLAQMEELMRKLLSEKEKDEYDSGDEMELFAPSIVATAYPPSFRMPHLSKFNGDGDPSDHLGMFNTLMMAHNIGPELRCLIFPSTLTGPAR